MEPRIVTLPISDSTTQDWGGGRAGTRELRGLTLNELVRQYLHDTLVVNGMDSALAMLQGDDAITEKCLEYDPITDTWCYFRETVNQLNEAVQNCMAEQDGGVFEGPNCQLAQQLYDMVMTQPPVEVIYPMYDDPAQKMGGIDPETPEYEEIALSPLPETLRFSIHPNPAQDEALIDAYIPEELSLSKPKVKFYDLLGREVMAYSLAAGSNKIVINTAEWTEGVYLYLMEAEGSMYYKDKLVIIK